MARKRKTPHSAPPPPPQGEPAGESARDPAGNPAPDATFVLPIHGGPDPGAAGIPAYAVQQQWGGLTEDSGSGEDVEMGEGGKESGEEMEMGEEEEEIGGESGEEGEEVEVEEEMEREDPAPYGGTASLSEDEDDEDDEAAVGGMDPGFRLGKKMAALSAVRSAWGMGAQQALLGALHPDGDEEDWPRRMLVGLERLAALDSVAEINELLWAKVQARDEPGATTAVRTSEIAALLGELEAAGRYPQELVRSEPVFW